MNQAMKMEKFYTGNIERLTIKSIHFYAGSKKVTTNRMILKRNVIFHETKEGILIDTNTGKRILSLDEVRSYLENHTGSKHYGIGHGCEFVDPTTLIPTPVSKKEAKQLKKQYQEINYF